MIFTLDAVLINLPDSDPAFFEITSYAIAVALISKINSMSQNLDSDVHNKTSLSTTLKFK